MSCDWSAVLYTASRGTCPGHYEVILASRLKDKYPAARLIGEGVGVGEKASETLVSMVVAIRMR